MGYLVFQLATDLWLVAVIGRGDKMKQNQEPHCLPLLMKASASPKTATGGPLQPRHASIRTHFTFALSNTIRLQIMSINLSLYLPTRASIHLGKPLSENTSSTKYFSHFSSILPKYFTRKMEKKNIEKVAKLMNLLKRMYISMKNPGNKCV